MNREARKLIDGHLDAIDRALADSGVSRSERRNVTDDVESQIIQMLGDDDEGDTAVANVKAILAELDPPEAYTAESGSERPALAKVAPPRFSRAALYGGVWAGFSFLAAFLWFCTHKVSAEPDQGDAGLDWLRYALVIFVLIPGMTAPIGTTVLGLVSVGHIRHSPGRLHGLPLALADALLFPLLVLDVLIYVVGEWIYDLIDGGAFGGPSQAYLLPIVQIATPVVIVAVDVLIAYWACRAALRPVK